MSPEKALHPTVVSKLWANEAFRGRVNLVAVDEAHLVSDW
jgi:superfamily II DNA helicase RecQ